MAVIVFAVVLVLRKHGFHLVHPDMCCYRCSNICLACKRSAWVLECPFEDFLSTHTAVYDAKGLALHMTIG